MPNLTDQERAALAACPTPEARTALLLEWVLMELRTTPAERFRTGIAARMSSANPAHPVPLKPGGNVEVIAERPLPIEDADQLLPAEKRGHTQPRRTNLGGGR